MHDLGRLSFGLVLFQAVALDVLRSISSASGIRLFLLSTLPALAFSAAWRRWCEPPLLSLGQRVFSTGGRTASTGDAT